MTTLCPGVVTDPALPSLADALTPERMEAALAAAKHFAHRRVRVVAADLMRHKPGRRAVIDYTMEFAEPGQGRVLVRAVGKMRARRPPRTAYRLLRALWFRGFDAASADGVSVPEPLGTVPQLGLWLQRRVPGQLATSVLAGADGARLARRIADAAVKLHRTGVEPQRSHGADQELDILARVLGEVGRRRPWWSSRLERILELSRRLAADLPAVTTTIHRDFYADQVVVDGDRLHLLDFDLYCRGHAALDVGNFVAHLIEQGLRMPAAAPALAGVGAALEARYLDRVGDGQRRAVRIYTAISLARHVYLAEVVPGRGDTASAVLDHTLAHLEELVDGRS